MACLSVLVSVCLLYPINVKTAEQIGPTFFVGPRVTPGKVYGWSNLQKFVSNKIRFFSNFLLYKIQEFFFTMYEKRTCWNRRWARRKGCDDVKKCVWKVIVDIKTTNWQPINKIFENNLITRIGTHLKCMYLSTIYVCMQYWISSVQYTW